MFDPKISYVLRELADWIEHRTSGEPSDTSRIELARSMAVKVEEVENWLESFLLELDHKTNEGQGDNDSWTDAADQPVAPFLVGQKVAHPPAEPVERCACSKLTFQRDTTTKQLKVTCNRGKTSTIDLDSLTRMSTREDDIVIAIARQLAAEHNLNVQDLYLTLKAQTTSIDKQTITVGTYFLSPRPAP